MNAIISKTDVMHAERSIRTASVVVPLLMERLKDLSSAVEIASPSSVWGEFFLRNGVEHIEVATSRVTDAAAYDVEREGIHRVDLHRPFSLDRRFDICIAIETPHAFASLAREAFVQNACGLSDLILFSCGDTSAPAGRPRSGWLSEWASLFEAQGYEFRDVLRPAVWLNARIDWRIVETLGCFVKRGSPAAAQIGTSVNGTLDIIHPWSLPDAEREQEAAAQRGEFEAEQSRLLAEFEAERSKLLADLSKLVIDQSELLEKKTALSRAINETEVLQREIEDYRLRELRQGSELERARREVEDAIRASEPLSVRLREAEEEIQRVRGEDSSRLMKCEQRAASLVAALEAVHASTSWRLSAPIRMLSRALRRAKTR